MRIRSYRHSLDQPSPLLVDPGRRQLMRAATMGSLMAVTSPLVARFARVDAAGEPLHAAVSTASEADARGVLRETLLASLNLVPVVGGTLSYLGALFIPGAGQTSEQRWRAYTDQRVADAVFKLVRSDLEGLSAVAMLYRNAVSSGDASAIRSQSIAVNTVFTSTIPRFRTGSPTQAMALLPLYAIAASLHLALLRDMVLGAPVLGFSAAYLETIQQQLRNSIVAYTGHVDATYAAGFQRTRIDHPHDWRNSDYAQPNRPLTQLLEFRAALQQSTLDIRDTWYAFDAMRFPGPVRVRLDREIFSPIIGRWDRQNLAPDQIPNWAPPASPLAGIRISTFGRTGAMWIQGFHVIYADGNELTTGARAEGATGRYPGPGESFTVVHARFQLGISRIELELNTGNREVFGRPGSPSDRASVSRYDGHRLSSIRAIGDGRKQSIGSVGSAIAGFQLRQQEARRISLQAYDQVAPVIAPQLLDWISL